MSKLQLIIFLNIIIISVVIISRPDIAGRNIAKLKEML